MEMELDVQGLAMARRFGREGAVGSRIETNDGLCKLPSLASGAARYTPTRALVAVWFLM